MVSLSKVFAGPFRKWITALAAAFFLWSCDFAESEQPRGVSGLAPEAAAKAVLDTLLAEGQFPSISAAVAVNGQVVFAEAVGLKDLESGAPADPDTVFRVYSVSKPVAGFAALALMDSGRLDPETPLGALLPNVPEPVKAITVRQLAGHVGGIRHYAKNGEWMRISGLHCDSPADALPVFINDPLIARPGDTVSYSSFGFVLLSAAIEAAAGQPFEDHVRTALLDRSGVTAIALDNPAARPPAMAVSYQKKGFFGFKKSPPVDNSCKFGGGGFNATPGALAKLFAAILSGKVVSPEALAYAFQPIEPKTGSENPTGFGFSVGVAANGMRFGAMSGSGEGGKSALVMLPEQNVVAVVMTNARGRELTQDAFNLAKIFLPENGTPAAN